MCTDYYMQTKKRFSEVKNYPSKGAKSKACPNCLTAGINHRIVMITMMVT
jgi:hypothetical protein